MSDPTPADPLDQFWNALVAECPTGDRLSSIGDDVRFVDLLNQLNDARVLLRDDSTQNALSDTNRIVAHDASIEVGSEIDGYRITRVLGRGGMGIVYAAEQLALGREIALKLIRTGPLATTEDLARFQVEASTTAALDHPGIVSVIDSGQWQGHHYFSMQLVNGPTLRAVFADGPIEPQQAAHYVREVSDAIQHAHDHGVLHRDIKPSNIILNEENDRPCVTDFGLAKLFEPNSETSTAYEWTKSGAMVGTPSYMSPEQALGQSKHVLPASDVYSIGAILYEALTGRAPFRAATPVETMRQVVDSQPAAPRSLNPEVSRDLETICLKCLSKKPEARYSSAGELRDELDRYLAGEPIHARPVSHWSKAWRWCVRNPAIAGSVAIVCGLAIGGGTLHNFRLAREVRNTRAAELDARNNLSRAQKSQQLAERDYKRAAQAVERMLYTLGAIDLEDLPKGDELRVELLKESAALQRQFAEDHPEDTNRVTKLIVAEQRLAEVMFEHGNTKDAQGILQDAIDRIENFQGVPDSTLHEAELVTRNKVANWLVAEGRYAESVEVLIAIIERAKELCDLDPENRTLWVSNLATNYSNLANISNDDEEKNKNSLQAIAAYEELVDVEQPSFRDRIGLSTARYVSCFTLQYVDEQAALEQYRAAMEVLEELQEEFPGNVEVKQRLGELHYNMALLFGRMDRRQEKLASLERSIEVRRALAADFPNKTIDISYLAGTYSAVGNTYSNDGDYEQALPHFDSAAEVLRELLSRHPDANAALNAQFGNSINRGIALLRLDRPAESILCFDKAVKIVGQLGERTYRSNEVPLADISAGEANCALGERAEGLRRMRAGISLAIHNAEDQSTKSNLDLLRICYVEFANGLGRYDFDEEAKKLIDEIAHNAALGPSSHHTAVSACGRFCQFRFQAPKPADQQLAAWFEARAIELFRKSAESSFEPEYSYSEDDAFEVFRTMNQFGEVGKVLEALDGKKTPSP